MTSMLGRAANLGKHSRPGRSYPMLVAARMAKMQHAGEMNSAMHLVDEGNGSYEVAKMLRTTCEGGRTEPSSRFSSSDRAAFAAIGSALSEGIEGWSITPKKVEVAAKRVCELDGYLSPRPVALMHASRILGEREAERARPEERRMAGGIAR